MNCERMRFANFSQYEVPNLRAVGRFASIMSPLLEMIRHRLKGDYLYGEEFLIKFLQEHRNSISSEDILDLSSHMSTCITHLYLIVITMLLSIVVAIPLICCTGVYFRKTLNPQKHRYRFCCESFLLFVDAIFLAVAAASLWFVGLETQTALENLPIFARTALANFDGGVGRFENDARVASRDLSAAVAAISEDVMAIPKRVVGIVDSRDMFDKTAPTTTRIDLEGNFSLEGRLVEDFDETGLEIDTSVRFDELYSQLERSVRKQDEKTLRNLKDTQRLVDLVSENATAAWKATIPDSVRRAVSCAASSVDSILKRTSLSGRKDRSKFFSLTTWLFLLPSIYALPVLLMVFVGILGTCKDLHVVSSRGVDANVAVLSSYKMATNLSVAFAWAILLLAATSYCVHVPLSIVCDGLKSGKLMTRYVDKNVWGKNSTWLSYRFKRQLTMLDDDLKVGELLHRCGRNKSVFLGLRLEKYIKDRTDPIKMSINATKTKTIVSKILDDARKSRTFNFEDFLRNLQEALRASSYENGTKIGHSSTVENRSRWTEARRQIGKFQMVSEEMRRAEKRLDEKLNGSRREIVRFLDETSRRVYCMARKTSKFTRDWFLNGQGNCVFLRSEYDAGVSTLCDYALELLNTIWLALSMMGFCILVASILSCRMSSYLRGAQETFLQNRCFSDVQRYSSLQAKYNNDPAVGLEEIKN